nr:MAG TPA: hypothetical protein [Caudoviricetes sp.]
MDIKSVLSYRGQLSNIFTYNPMSFPYYHMTSGRIAL